MAIAYAHKLNKRISTIAEEQNTTLQVMSVEHIYSELLAHYYVYIGLNTIPGCQGLPLLGAYYDKASEATLNPTESRESVLFLMDQIQKHIGGRYDEGD